MSPSCSLQVPRVYGHLGSSVQHSRAQKQDSHHRLQNQNVDVAEGKREGGDVASSRAGNLVTHAMQRGKTYAPVLVCAPDKARVPSGCGVRGVRGVRSTDKCLPPGAFRKVPQQRGLGRGQSVQEESGENSAVTESWRQSVLTDPPTTWGLPEGKGHGFSILSWNCGEQAWGVGGIAGCGSDTPILL